MFEYQKFVESTSEYFVFFLVVPPQFEQFFFLSRFAAVPKVLSISFGIFFHIETSKREKLMIKKDKKDIKNLQKISKKDSAKELNDYETLS